MYPVYSHSPSGTSRALILVAVRKSDASLLDNYNKKVGVLYVIVISCLGGMHTYAWECMYGNSISSYMIVHVVVCNPKL